MNVWSGSVALGPGLQLEGIRLVDPTSHWQSDISKEAKLSLRSFVNPALIPLHARIGPNLELHTSNAESSQWLQSKLTSAIWVNDDELDLHRSLQCPVGLLVSVEGTITKKISGSVTSDILIYGVLSGASACARPPTPPHSSPSEVDGPTPSISPHELRIYAAPLSTSLLTQVQAFPYPQPSSGEEQHQHGRCAEFLPDISSPSPKRKRVASLFEVAAQHHRRVRQKGGEGVSQLMAHARPLSSSSQNLQALRIKREPEENGPPLDRIAAHRSRSMSIGAGLHRPGSVRGARATPGVNADPQKRAPTPNPFHEHNATRGSQQIQLQSSSLSAEEKPLLSSPGSPSKDPETVITENKNLITRTILTCMRLYGFHRASMRAASTRPALGATDPELDTPAEGMRAETPAPAVPADDDEFKAMYHATYKAAAFALRRFLKEPLSTVPGSAPAVLQKEKAMTCIDELLRLFCEEH